MLKEIDHVQHRLTWMRDQGVWPNGARYLWTDAFGLVLLNSLYQETHDEQYVAQAHELVDAVERVLGRERGLRIGEEPDRDGQYYHYLAMWLFALARFAGIDARYRQRGIDLVRQIHRPFLVPGVGVHWKMQEDLSGPYPGCGIGASDVFSGYVAYRQLDEQQLAVEIDELRPIILRSYRDMIITQDLALGMMLWQTHFYPDEDWARWQRSRCLQTLELMWQPEGYFSRQPHMPEVCYAFTNYGVSVGLQAVRAMPERVRRLNDYFAHYRSIDEYDYNAITHVMACSSHFPGLLLATPARVEE